MEINQSLDDLVDYISKSLTNEKENSNELILNIFYEVIANAPTTAHAKEIVRQLLNDYFVELKLNPELILGYKTNLALSLAQKNQYMDLSLSWILDYFARTKTATIDLNRYKVESFLMTSNSKLVNEAIINRLCSTDCYVREHMADIIGEKRLIAAAPLLYIQLAKEQNYFTAQSMIEAIGKIKQPGGIDAVEQWISKNKDEIINTKQLFVLKHAYFAISALDDTEKGIHIQQFNKEFAMILKDYYII